MRARLGQPVRPLCDGCLDGDHVDCAGQATTDDALPQLVACGCDIDPCWGSGVPA